MLFFAQNYTGFSKGRLKREKILETIYGFIESGFPVILAIKTDDSMHAITIIGHTFDKNSWQAMADVGYFSMTPRSEAYHPNVTWVENLIIQDDNFGPYYFLKTHMLEDLVAAMIVPLPYGPIILPYEATNAAATKTIYAKDFILGIQNVITTHKFMPKNKTWFDEFVSHLRRICGDGLVLRPVLRARNEVFAAYTGHEFINPIQSLFNKVADTELFWMIELSWPDIYCFGQSTCGMILFHSQDKDLSQMLVHLPGILMLIDDKAPDPTKFIIAKNEDAPRQHLMPGKNG
jgi:hypothetical protein